MYFRNGLGKTGRLYLINGPMCGQLHFPPIELSVSQLVDYEDFLVFHNNQF